jgi:hypothetical protein
MQSDLHTLCALLRSATYVQAVCLPINNWRRVIRLTFMQARTLLPPNRRFRRTLSSSARGMLFVRICSTEAQPYRECRSKLQPRLNLSACSCRSKQRESWVGLKCRGSLPWASEVSLRGSVCSPFAISPSEGVLQGDSVAANTHSKSVELRYSHALSPRHVLLGEEFEVSDSARVAHLTVVRCRLHSL